MINSAGLMGQEPSNSLPQQLRILYIPGPKSPRNWLCEALDGESVCRVEIMESSCLALALEKLREETFDAVLVDADADSRDCHTVIEAIRAGSHDHQAVIILGDESNSLLATHCFEAGADGFVAVQTSIPRELLWQIARAAKRGRLRAENAQLRQRQQRHTAIERDEVLKLTSEQEAILRLAASVTEAGENAPPELTWLSEELRELLKASVIMGSGNLFQEINRFVDRIRETQTPRYTVMTRYSDVLRDMLEELGTRSSRHVYNRANLLLIDLLLKLSSPRDAELMNRAASEKCA